MDNLIDAPDQLLVQQSLDYRELFHLDIYGRDDTGHVIMCHVRRPLTAPPRCV